MHVDDAGTPTTLGLNPIGGNVGIGTLTPDTTLHVVSTGADTTSANHVLKIESDASGTPSANYGTGIAFLADTTSFSRREMGSVEMIWTDPTESSQSSAFVVKTVGWASSPTERMKLDGNRADFYVPIRTQGSVTADKGFRPGAESISHSGSSITPTMGANILLLTLTGGGAISTITGCNSELYAQGQSVTIILVGATGGYSFSFSDTSVGSLTTDSIVLTGAYSVSSANGTGRGSTLTLVCTTIDGVKKWVEVSRSINSN